MFSRVVSFTWISIVTDVSKALKNGDDVKALNRTGGGTERRAEKLNLYMWSVTLTHHYLMFSSASAVLTSISGVIDGFVRLDEDVSGVKGHHQHRLLGVEATEVHPQIHKLVLLLVAIQTIWGKLWWSESQTHRRVFRYDEGTSLLNVLCFSTTSDWICTHEAAHWSLSSTPNSVSYSNAVSEIAMLIKTISHQTVAVALFTSYKTISIKLRRRVTCMVLRAWNPFSRLSVTESWRSRVDFPKSWMVMDAVTGLDTPSACR